VTHKLAREAYHLLKELGGDQALVAAEFPTAA
jgi:hypothetical protein